MSVLVDPREAAPEEMVLPIRHDQEAEAGLHQGQAGDVVREVDHRGAHSLIFQEADDIPDRTVAETEPTALVGRGAHPLLDRLPTGSRRHGGIARHPGLRTIQTKKLLEACNLPGQDRATADRRQDRLLRGRIGTKEGDHRFLGPELAGQEIPDVTPVEVGEAVKLQAGNRSIAGLELRDRRPGHSQVPRNFVLGEAACLPSLPQTPGQLSFSHSHGSDDR